MFLIAETPNTTTHAPGMEPTTLQAWRLPLNDQDPKDVVEAYYSTHPIGTTLYIVEDTKVQAFDVSLKLEAIEDPRLDEEEEATQ